MFLSRRSLPSLAWFVLAVALFTTPAHADQLIYVPLAQPCRLLDTRTSTGGSGPLTAAHGAYLFGTSVTDISSAAQHGSASGCGIPDGVAAVSVNMNLLDATAAGNIATWSADVGSAASNIGTAVYNPTVASPMAGQVQYNTGYTTVPVGNSSAGRFYLQVANGQIDMTINLVGYWLPISSKETRRADSIALGFGTTASGIFSTAMGFGSLASSDTSTAIGFNTIASGFRSTALGYETNANGAYSTAIGQLTNASGDNAMALGTLTSADGEQSTTMGSKVGSGGHKGSFIYGDDSSRGGIVNSADNQFMAIADGGFVFVSDKSGGTGAELKPGTGSWTVLSDRNAKTAVQPVDGREVLKKIAALPLSTWQYKAQDAKYRHMGPMAQDFCSAFQLGESDKGIDTVDADGVALAAIQGLHAELIDRDRQIAALRGEKDREIAALRTELSAQKTETASQKKRMAALESLAGDVASLKVQLAALRQSSPAQTAVALAQP